LQELLPNVQAAWRDKWPQQHRLVRGWDTWPAKPGCFAVLPPGRSWAVGRRALRWQPRLEIEPRGRRELNAKAASGEQLEAGCGDSRPSDAPAGPVLGCLRKLLLFKLLVGGHEEYSE